MPVVLLSFDLEPFDLPLEYGEAIAEARQYATTMGGLPPLLNLLDSMAAPATFFSTASLALREPRCVRSVSAGHEIASHGLNHDALREDDLPTSKQVLESVCNTSVTGFRSPRMQPVREEALLEAGYSYNASLHPTWVPGRYNNLAKPRTPHMRAGILNIPASVTPLVRFPLFWLSFKNLPLRFIKAASAWTLRRDRCLSLYFHPWEFADLSTFRLPAIVKRVHGVELLARLESYLAFLTRRATFITAAEFDQRFRALLV